jgi:hypothetical protein
VSYGSGAAFRRGLEQRLLNESRQQGLPLVRLRKTVAFERFVARLVQDQPACWLLKGGFALQLRLGLRARTTLDLDMLLVTPTEGLHPRLTQAAKLDLGDWFEFTVGQSGTRLPGVAHGGMRFGVTAMLDGRVFEGFHVDVGMGDPVVDAAEFLSLSDRLAFAGIATTEVPCYPATQHLAEKVHAYVRPHTTGANTRVKDLVDILLIAGSTRLDAARLWSALAATFAARERDTVLPSRLPDPPGSWAGTFGPMAREVGLGYGSLSEAFAAASQFLDPVLQCDGLGTWVPEEQAWTGAC